MSVGHLPSTTGSSPHTRGALHGDRVDVHPIRIIPAYAGSTLFAIFIQLVDKDHPRIRGEHDDSDQYVIDGLGSSPHTRGAPRGASGGVCRVSDHPRIRGEHGFGRPASTRMGGSSPHTRGARKRRSGRS